MTFCRARRQLTALRCFALRGGVSDKSVEQSSDGRSVFGSSELRTTGFKRLGLERLLCRTAGQGVPERFQQVGSGLARVCGSRFGYDLNVLLSQRLDAVEVSPLDRFGFDQRRPRPAHRRLLGGSRRPCPS